MAVQSASGGQAIKAVNQGEEHWGGGGGGGRSINFQMAEAATVAYSKVKSCGGDVFWGVANFLFVGCFSHRVFLDHLALRDVTDHQAKG